MKKWGLGSGLWCRAACPSSLHLKPGSASWCTMDCDICAGDSTTVGMMWLQLSYSHIFSLIPPFVSCTGTRHLPAAGQSWQPAIRAAPAQQACSYKLSLCHVLSFEGHLFINGHTGRNQVGRNTLCKQASSYWHFHFFAEFSFQRPLATECYDFIFVKLCFLALIRSAVLRAFLFISIPSTIPQHVYTQTLFWILKDFRLNHYFRFFQ